MKIYFDYSNDLAKRAFGLLIYWLKFGITIISLSFILMWKYIITEWNIFRELELKFYVWARNMIDTKHFTLMVMNSTLLHHWSLLLTNCKWQVIPLLSLASKWINRVSKLLLKLIIWLIISKTLTRFINCLSNSNNNLINQTWIINCEYMQPTYFTKLFTFRWTRMLKMINSQFCNAFLLPYIHI